MLNTRKPRGFSAIEAVLVVILVILLVFIGWYVWHSRQTKQAAVRQSATPSSSTKPAIKPATTVPIDSPYFTLTLPGGWAKTTQVFPGHASSEYRYYNSNTGDYFEVLIDPGSDYSADATWVYDVRSDGVSLVSVSEGKQCVKKGVEDADAFCSSGDNKLDLGILISSFDGSAEIKGHNYFFFAGNTKTETPNLEVYRQILASFRAK